MRQGIAFAVFAGVIIAATGAGAACPMPPPGPAPTKPHAKPRKPDPNCVNLSGLPQISEHIVAAEPGSLPATVKPTVTDLSAPTPSSASNSLTVGGLAVGLTKPDPGVRPVPTVGYHWSLD